MRALVLAAGLGTRLQPLTLARAKAAAPVDGEPLVRRTIGWLVRQGLTDLVLNLHHKPETITAVVGDGSDLGARVRYSWESPVLGSAGGPRHALPLLLDSASQRSGAARTCVLVNGDTLTDVSLRPLADAHAATHAMVTMALVPNREPEKYGGVRMGDDGSISGFVARGAQAIGSYHFIGVQVADAGVFADLKDGEHINSTHGVYDTLIASNPGSVRGYICNAAFWDIGTPDDLAATDAAFSRRT